MEGACFTSTEVSLVRFMPSPGVNEPRNAEADDDGDGCRDEVEADRLHAHAPEFFHIADARHADDERGENDGNDHHLDEVDEHRADRGNPPFDEGRACRAGYEADDDRKHEGDEDFDGKMHGNLLLGANQ
jgi:hypothetical protein